MALDPSQEAELAALKRRIAELEAAAQAPAAQHSTHTAGGSHFSQAVQVTNGNLIGRDSLTIIHQHFSSNDGGVREDAQVALASYLHKLAADLTRLRLGQIDDNPRAMQCEPLELSDIYVPLDTTYSVPKQRSLNEALAQHHRQAEWLRDEKQKFRKVGALEALAHFPRLTLIGEAGSGKSTFGAHVLLALVRHWQGLDLKLNDAEALGEHWGHGAPLPLRVTLRHFAQKAPDGAQKKLRAGDLWSYLADELRDMGVALPDRAYEVLQRVAQKQGVFVLFDGLDECGDDQRRARVMDAVEHFIEGASRGSRFLLTARPYAFPTGTDAARGAFQLDKLSDGSIELFIHRWYDARMRRGWDGKPDAEAKRDQLLSSWQRPDVEPLVRNPLLLTLAASLHSDTGELPRSRAELYERSVTLLLKRWNRREGDDAALLERLDPRLTLDSVRSALEQLAFGVHHDNPQEKDLADIPQARLVDALRPLVGGSHDRALGIVEFIEQRAGLLRGRGYRVVDGVSARQYAFPHRTFQEYLAARHLQARHDFAQQCAELTERDLDGWKLALPLAARVAGVERAATAADALIGSVHTSDVSPSTKPGPNDWKRAWIAASMLNEHSAPEVERNIIANAVAHRVRGWLVAAMTTPLSRGGLAARSRAAIGDELARLVDPRFDPERWYLPADATHGFVRIPANPAFVWGTRKADRKRVAKLLGADDIDDDEINDRPVAVPEFWIGRYPVTVAQFQAFVDDDRFKPGDRDALRDPATRPVRWVNHDEALAYCRWLGGKLGCEATLPSEHQWEWAARGGLVGRAFSWGDEADPERANYFNDSWVGSTSAVGCYEPNGYGLCDMLGNVWEWMRDEAEKGSYFVRGGSWDDNPGDARCAVRDRYAADCRGYDLGFRVVLRSPPALS